MKQNKVGIVGVGLMGHGIATNIAKHGHALSLLEHPGNQPLDTLKAAGARTYSTGRELANAVDVVILCVTGSPQVESVLVAEGGVLEGMRPGTLIIDCSTAIPSSTERMAALVHEAKGRFIDAAMTRTPKEAAEGRLNLLIGGDADVLAEHCELLECFAENITHVGPVGAGHRMKLLHNYVSLGSVALIAEAAANAEHAGISAETFVRILAQGGGAGTALERIKPFILAKDPSGLRFTVANAQKDLGYYVAMARDSHVACSIAEAVHETLTVAVQRNAGALMPELVQLIAGAASAR
jgi:3-hydroxyisobutyrate dehydrogenase-like beta-hydroxyacid dehydrogenase